MASKALVQQSPSLKKPQSGKATARSARRILVLHGPNLNLLGTREPAIYGSESLADINRTLIESGRTGGIAVDTFQSNHEGALVDRIQAADRKSVV